MGREIKEEWKEIEGYEGRYTISSLGRVKSHYDNFLNFSKEGRIVPQRLNRHGYLRVNLYKQNIHKTPTVHRLVAQAFIPNPVSKLHVNHINGIKTDNRKINLEWATPRENCTHSVKILKKNIGELQGNASLCDNDIKDIWALKDKLTQEEIAKKFHVTPPTINKVFTFRSWTHISNNIVGAKRSPKAKLLTKEEVLLIREMRKYDSNAFSLKWLAKCFKRPISTISMVVNRKSYKDF